MSKSSDIGFITVYTDETGLVFEIDGKRTPKGAPIKKTPIDAEMARIRNCVNRGDYWHAKLKGRKWEQMCSCLDVIEDSELAVLQYIKLDDNAPLGMKYLCTYGFLQAAVLLQDAIKNLAEVFEIEDKPNWRNNPTQKIIREIRVRIAGHPVSAHVHQLKQECSFHLIRGELEDGHIALYSMSSNSISNMDIDDPKQLARDHLGYIRFKLSKFLDHQSQPTAS